MSSFLSKWSKSFVVGFLCHVRELPPALLYLCLSGACLGNSKISAVLTASLMLFFTYMSGKYELSVVKIVKNLAIEQLLKLALLMLQQFSAVLAILYLPLISDWVSQWLPLQSHFWALRPFRHLIRVMPGQKYKNKKTTAKNNTRQIKTTRQKRTKCSPFLIPADLESFAAIRVYHLQSTGLTIKDAP